MLRDRGCSEEQEGSCDTSVGGSCDTLVSEQRGAKPRIPLASMEASEDIPNRDQEPGGGTENLNRDSRVTGPSCLALRHAVSGLHRLDDFNREKIGSGFFSEVFKVTHRVTGQVMVLKMNLLHSNRPNMLKEVQLMNQLCHANVLGFMGACVHEGQLHALTEYINGGSLEQLIQTSSIELTYRVREKLALDIARGLEYLHSRDVFHRDLTSKNVLIKKNELSGELTAVVGDFGLAAKIPRPGGNRLHTVGSPYWMSPECLKGQWYDQRSDVFSYGIILCELIALCAADPDVLPRTENFGLDYLAFIEICSTSHPPPDDFLKLAFSCCNYEPKNRPTFSEIVKLLERSLEVLASSPRSTLPGVVPTCAAIKSPGIGARSEEVLPTTECLTQQPPTYRKLFHRRSLSEDVGLLVFPPHTAPSDKARCHSLNVSSPLKHVGEEMARGDPHYKPSALKANPFTALGQCKGVKILASTNSTDLFSSCFELPSPSPFSSTDERSQNPFDSSFEGNNEFIYNPRNYHKNNVTEATTTTTTGCDDQLDAQTKSSSPSEASVIVEPVVKPSHIFKYNNQNRCKQHQRQSECPSGNVSEKSRGVCCNLTRKAKPSLSLPSSPTFARRRNTMTVLATDLFTRFTKPGHSSSDDDSTTPRFYAAASSSPLHYSVHLDPQKRVPSLYAHPLFNKTLASHHHHHHHQHPSSLLMTVDDPKSAQSAFLPPLRSCSSSWNIATTAQLDELPASLPGGLALPGVFYHPGGPVVSSAQALRRRGSCESGFFSNVGEDFCLPGVETVTASSVTLSSSSATSSLFLDSGGVTVSCCSLEDMATPLRGVGGHVGPGGSHQHKRSSSVYTDSSEDVSSLGGSDLQTPWDERQSATHLQAAPQHISKIVEYFERKHSNNVSLPSTATRWDPLDSTAHPTGGIGAHNRQYHQLNHREYYQLRRCYLQQQDARSHVANPSTNQTPSSQFMTSFAQSHKRGINQRLMICEGAVRSKLPLFDKKIND